MRRNRVHMALAAYWLVAEPASGVDHDAKQQHARLQLSAIRFAAYVHRDVVDGIRSGAIGVEQTLADIIEFTRLGGRAENSNTVLEVERVGAKTDVESLVCGVEEISRKLDFFGFHFCSATKIALPFSRNILPLNPWVRIGS